MTIRSLEAEESAKLCDVLPSLIMLDKVGKGHSIVQQGRWCNDLPSGYACKVRQFSDSLDRVGW